MTPRETRRLAREARFEQYAREGLSYAEAGQREGMEQGYAGTFLKPAYRRLNLTPPKAGPKKRNPKEAVLDENFRTVRSRLADELYNYRHESKKHPSEIAAEIDVPVKLQTKALNPPFNYDWKLSSIAKLAVVKNQDPVAFIRKLTENR